MKRAKNKVPKMTSFFLTVRDPKSLVDIFLFFILHKTKRINATIEKIEVKLSAMGCIGSSPI